jgi:spore coat-associated protein N
MKKILGLTIAFMLVMGIAGIGTWAYFSDTETSTGNTITAGTLDLKTDDMDGVTQTLLATNMAPGDVVGPETITLKNSGSVTGATLDLAFSYIESDGSPNPTDMTADETAAMIEVTILNYGNPSVSILSSISDGNLNGYPDIEDLKTTGLSGLSGIDASATKDFEIAVQLRTETGNDFQADGITVTMTFTLNQ